MKKRLIILMAAFTFAFGAAGLIGGSGSGNGGSSTQELPTIF